MDVAPPTAKGIILLTSTKWSEIALSEVWHDSLAFSMTFVKVRHSVYPRMV